MAIAVKLDFDNTYNIEPLSTDLRVSRFISDLEDGSMIPQCFLLSFWLDLHILQITLVITWG